MIILILFAFIAGLVTVLSPCILPILPIVLSGSVTGGKQRPLGVVTGFISSFTFFTLFLSAIVQATGLSADVLRTVSVVVVGAFGVSLLVPQFQVMLEQLFSRLAGAVSSAQQKAQTVHSDFIAGIVIGISLGLVWTPCVGPILASVITLAATGSVSGQAVLITLAYSVGTAIPLLAITWGGRELLNRHPWLVQNSGRIQKVFGVLMILTAIAIHFNLDRSFQAYVLEAFPQYGVGLTQFEDNEAVRTQLDELGTDPMDKSDMGKPMDQLSGSNYPLAPELIPGGEWFNTDPLTMQRLRRKVVLVDFWTYTCINCIRTLPYLRTWHDKYADDGLVILGIHTPEFEFEKDAANVQEAIEDFELKYAVMQDNNYATWRAYNNRYWPAKYLIDKNGRIRYTHFGEGAYDETESMIQELLRETGSEVTDVINNPSYRVTARTPELYLGYFRMDYLDDPAQLKRDESSTYSIPSQLRLHHFAFGGSWEVNEEYAMPARGANFKLHFDASQVFLVMRPTSPDATRVRVILDGEIVGEDTAGKDVVDGVVTVDTDRLYKLINLPEPGQHILELQFLDGKIELFAFTFG